MKTVLLVEDDQWMGECYATWLRSFGYKPVWVRDAQSALDTLDVEQPVAIVLDMMLPFANGVQLLHILASHADLMNIPVLVCSSAPPRQSLAAYGVHAVLHKATLTPKQLRSALEETFKHAAVSH